MGDRPGSPTVIQVLLCSRSFGCTPVLRDRERAVKCRFFRFFKLTDQVHLPMVIIMPPVLADTEEAIAQGYRSRLIEEFQILGFAEQGWVTGPNGEDYIPCTSLR